VIAVKRSARVEGLGLWRKGPPRRRTKKKMAKFFRSVRTGNATAGCQFGEPCFSLRRISQRPPLALQPQFASANQPPQTLDKVLAKAPTQLGVVDQSYPRPAKRLETADCIGLHACRRGCAEDQANDSRIACRLRRRYDASTSLQLDHPCCIAQVIIHRSREESFLAEIMARNASETRIRPTNLAHLVPIS
jgi:hypothetical protein